MVSHEILLLGKPGCHLCDDARAVIARVADDLDVPWSERSILDDPQLLEKYGEWIPVTFVDGVQHDYYRVDEARLRRALL
nr:glutaredoxin family protein [Branchiibius sp. NY16-3462-2]